MAARAWSKKEFAIALGLMQPSGHIDYKSLRKHYITPALLRDIGMDPDHYKEIRVIPARYSRKICQELDITEEDLRNS